MDGTQNLVLIEPRADGLSDLGEQRKFLGAALRVVHDRIIFQGQADLQCQPDQQSQVRRAKHPARSVREQDHAEIVLPGLQAHGGDVVNALFGHHLAELQKPSARKRRQGLGHFRHAAEGNESAAPVGQFADIFSGAAFFQALEEISREATLHRRQNGAPTLGDAKHRATRRQGSDQAIQNALHAGDQVFGGEQPRRIHTQSGKRQRIFLHRAALVFRQHHYHRDAQRQLRNRAQHVGELQVRIAELSKQHQHRPQREGHRQQGEGQRISAVRVAIKEEGAIEQHQGHAHFEAKARVGNNLGMKHPAHHVLLQIPKTERDPARSDSDVIPTQAELLAHEASRDEDTQRHRRQKQRGQQRHDSGRCTERTPGVEDVMERVSSPSQLPGAEVVLPGLLVKVSEHQEEQQSYNGRHYEQTNCDAVHGAETATSARVIRNF